MAADAGRYLQLDLGGVVATARLYQAHAPRTVDALWHMLPIEASAIPVRWTGEAATVHVSMDTMPEGEIENPVTSIYPGAIVMRVQGAESRILIGYGIAEFRLHLGVDYNTLVGMVVTNRQALFAMLATVPDRGRVPIRIRRFESPG